MHARQVSGRSILAALVLVASCSGGSGSSPDAPGAGADANPSSDGPLQGDKSVVDPGADAPVDSPIDLPGDSVDANPGDGKGGGGGADASGGMDGAEAKGCPSPLPAFRGAEGFGAQARGGRAGAVCEVSSLADSGSGTLRDCVENRSGPRTVVFRVGGTIELADRHIRFQGSEGSYVTVAGQTAPGGGVQIKHYGFRFDDDAHDVLVRHLRIRPGREKKEVSEDVDAIEMAPGEGKPIHNLMFDHDSFEYGFDENWSIWGTATDISLQYCIISMAMLHGQNGEQAKGILIGGDDQYGTGATRFSIHHDIISSNPDRSPRIIHGLVDLRDNVIYNYQGNNSSMFGNGGSWDPGKLVEANLVNNLWKKGPITYASYDDVGWLRDDADLRVYVSGNRGPKCPTGCTGEWDIGFRQEWGSYSAAPEARFRVMTPFAVPPVTTEPVPSMVDLVLAGAGATRPARDALDVQVVDDFRTGKGAPAADTPFYPALAAGSAPADADHDGMPDAWESAHGLDPKDPSDRNGTSVDGCYTNLEAYLGDLAGD